TATINAPVTNQGTFIFEGASTLTGALTTANGSILRVQGNNTCCTGTLTIANGFTNNGSIELTSIGSSSSTFNVTTGALVNAPGSTISSLGAGSRTLGALLDNQGTVTLSQDMTLSKSGAAHVNSGTIDLTSGDLTLTQT